MFSVAESGVWITEEVSVALIVINVFPNVTLIQIVFRKANSI